jgi:hypothetical protein
MKYVEFHRVLTSGINSNDFKFKATHCCLNRSRFCGDARIFVTKFRSYKNVIN